MAVDLLKKNVIDYLDIISITEEQSNGAEAFKKLTSGDEEKIKAILVN